MLVSALQPREKMFPTEQGNVRRLQRRDVWTGNPWGFGEAPSPQAILSVAFSDRKANLLSRNHGIPHALVLMRNFSQSECIRGEESLYCDSFGVRKNLNPDISLRSRQRFLFL